MKLRRMLFVAGLLAVTLLTLSTSIALAASPSDQPLTAWPLDSPTPPPAPGIGYWYEHSLKQYFSLDGRRIHYGSGTYQWADGTQVTPDNAPTSGAMVPIGHRPDISTVLGSEDTSSTAPLASPLALDFLCCCGTLTAHKTYTTGVRMDVNVYNRSPMTTNGDSEYYWIGENCFNSGVPNLIALEYCEWDPSQHQGWFEPMVHIRYSDGSQYVSPLASQQFWVNGNSASWHTLQMVRNPTSGGWYVYADGITLYSNLYWPTSPYYYYPKSSFELPYASLSDPHIHDPANHFMNINFRGSDYTTWYVQSSTNVPNGVDQYTFYIDYDGVTQHAGQPYSSNFEYPSSRYWYDWMAHKN
jgi:hypothetical protein